MNRENVKNNVADQLNSSDNTNNEKSFLSWFVADVVDPIFEDSNNLTCKKTTEYKENRNSVVDVAGVADTNSVDEVNSSVNHDLIIEWLQIAMNEGHIEPSQPLIGQYTGWPQRPYLINSLWTDFICWIRKNKNFPNGLHESMDCRTLFEYFCDQIFDRKKEKYEFPKLNISRKRFQDLTEK